MDNPGRQTLQCPVMSGKGKGKKAATKGGETVPKKDPLDQATKNLDDTIKIAHETEEIGAGIFGKLRKDRVKLEQANRELDDLESNLNHANKHLSNMGRRVAHNNVLLMFVIFLLSAAIGGVVYFRWFAGSNVFA